MTNNGYAPGDLVAHYIKLRDKLEQLEEEHAKRIAPYKAAMTAIEGKCAIIMRETNQTAIKCEAGIAYTKTLFTARVADRTAFHPWVMEHRLTQFLTAHVAKEAVGEYMEINNGRRPPGIESTTIQRVNFRRS